LTSSKAFAADINPTPSTPMAPCNLR
jgi:hypothetical protein